MNQTVKHVNMCPPAGQAHADAEPRIYGLFPARVRGVDSSGATFEALTLIDSFSAAAFELRLHRRVEAGCHVLVIADIHDATIALHATVVRAEPLPRGAHLLTINVKHHRFLKEPAPAPQQ